MTYKIKNWSKFQHFKDRRPPWVKLYRDLLDDMDWFSLDPVSAKNLINLWLIASEYDGELPTIDILAFRLRLKNQEVTRILSNLSHWLEQDDINVISSRYQDDRPETETEKETKRETKTPEGVSVDLWKDFLIYRKRLKAPVTDRVLARLIKEAELAKMPLADVLETIIFKGWRSFEASWIQQAQQKAKELPLGTDQQIEEAYRIECGGNPQQSRFGSYFEMKKFILDARDKKKK
jgi:hypothetical protein